MLLKENKIGGKNATFKYLLRKGKWNHRTIINRYNALLLCLTTDWSNDRIFASKYFRKTKLFSPSTSKASGRTKTGEILFRYDSKGKAFDAKTGNPLKQEQVDKIIEANEDSLVGEEGIKKGKMGSQMRELVYPAKMTLLNVCKGQFP